MMVLSSSLLRFSALFRILIAFAIAFASASWAGPPLGSLTAILLNPGLYIDLLQLLFLIFILWFTSLISVTGKPLNMALNGLTLWVAGQSFDLMDEIFHQPRGMAYYCEDLLILSGMLLTVISIYKVMLRMNSHYSYVSKLSLHDELTQLPNRRYFIENISKMKNRAQALIIIDLDYFKNVNDTWGHAVGDRVLFEFGRQLYDINNLGIIGYRIGGEEFAVIVEGLSCPDVSDIAESIRINAQKVIVGDDRHLSVSIGVGIRSPDEDYESLMSRVDSALYLAKKKGRNRVEMADTLSD